MHNHLSSLSPQNIHNLEKIQSAMLVIALDSTSSSSSREDQSWSVWTGRQSSSSTAKAKGSGIGRNRWFDKHQLIVGVDGESGFNAEREFCVEGFSIVGFGKEMMMVMMMGEGSVRSERWSEVFLFLLLKRK